MVQKRTGERQNRRAQRWHTEARSVPVASVPENRRGAQRFPLLVAQRSAPNCRETGPEGRALIPLRVRVDNKADRKREATSSSLWIGPAQSAEITDAEAWLTRAFPPDFAGHRGQPTRPPARSGAQPEEPDRIVTGTS